MHQRRKLDGLQYSEINLSCRAEYLPYWSRVQERCEDCHCFLASDVVVGYSIRWDVRINSVVQELQKLNLCRAQGKGQERVGD